MGLYKRVEKMSAVLTASNSIVKPRVLKKMITVFNLAIAYHNIDEIEIQDNIRDLLKEELILSFNKHLYTYFKYGHKKIDSLENIKNINDALEFAECSFVKA